MSTLLQIFANNLLPILLIAGVGFVAGRRLSLDPRPLGRVIFYIFSPALVFNLLTQSRLSFDDLARMMGFVVIYMSTMGGLAFLAGKLFRLKGSLLTVIVLTSLFVNAGNYGLPVVSFTFGQEALAYAAVFFSAHSILFYTLGVLIASLGRLRFKEALIGLFRVPVVYAVALAMLFIRCEWSLPEPLQRAVSLAAAATIPSMLVLLGLELQRVKGRYTLSLIGLPVFMRLIVGPAMALGISALLQLQGPARLAGVTEAAMPTAVMTTLLAREYETETSLVTMIVFTSTLLSPLTLTPLLYLLGR